ncbi:hypothetical protein GCM10022278_17280 [Allohahella marinimesophila]|uniref:Solute-binding protein family 3/N-terminal domain-containing protein n=1 Tax=Allohahella marinimesophila TaxID=1054972 RepID=A0ABP7P4D9_9GAMM
MPLTLWLWLLTGAPALAAEEARRQLVCSSTVYQPYVIQDEQGIRGIDVDVVREIGRRLNIDIDIRLSPWTRLEKELAAGEQDCVFSYFHTPEREAFAHFTGVPMHITEYTVFVKSEAGMNTNGLSLLYGKRIGVNRGFKTTDAFEAAREAGHIDVELVTEDTQSFRMLMLGRVNGVLTNADVGRYITAQLELEDVVALQPPLATEAAYLVLRRAPELEDLVEQFNWALFEILRDGTYREIQERYGSR